MNQNSGIVKTHSLNLDDDFHYLAKDPSQQPFRVYATRWLVLLAFSTFTFTNSLAFVQYSPIVPIAAQYYSVSEDAVVWLSTTYYIAYFYLAPFAIKPLELRLDLTLILAAFFTAIGAWLKFIAQQNYILALLGFMLIGLGQTCILAAPAYISDRWFAQHERTLATSIGSFLNYMGMNFSLLYSAIVFESENVNENSAIQRMNFLFAILNSVAFFLCLVFVKNHPPTPPSYSAIAEKQPILKSYKEIFKKSESLLDLVSMSIFIGASWGYLIVVAILLQPFNYTQKDIGFVTLCYSTTGTLGGTLASVYVDHQVKQNQRPNYDLFIKAFISLGFFGIITKALLIEYVSDVWIITLSGVIGLGLNSFLPLAAQGFIEKLFPCFELVLITAMMQFANGQLFGFLLNYVLLLDICKTHGLWILAGILGPFYLYIVLFYKTTYLRYEREQMSKID